MFEASIKHADTMTVAFLEMHGDYDQIPQGFGRLYQWVTEYDHKPEGMPMAVYMTPPSTDSEKNRWELWVPIEGGEIQFGPDYRELGVKQVEPAEVASTTHVGPYEGIADAYRKLAQWIDENGYEICGASRESYLNSPEQVPPEEYRTEIQFPVKKR